MKTFFIKLLLFTISLFPLYVRAQANWSRDFEVLTPRENIYQLPADTFQKTVMEGRRHALLYPVDQGELFIPYQPLKTFFEADVDDPVRKLIYQITKVVSPFKNMKEVFAWLGLHEIPKSPQPQNPNPLPTLSQSEADLPMGATLLHTENGEALTFGCAACHTGDLFGVKVLGLTNRFPRANDFFHQGQRVAPYINSFVIRDLLKTTEGERLMMVQSKKAMRYVGTKSPVVLGLDTSLAQVAMSLSKREKDPYASRSATSFRFPRHNKLEKMVADSKPAVWWNVKYKNRWLSDGSIVSGNPVHTNFLWNEIGRGADLKKLEKWMTDNHHKIEALTAAVFATKPPRYETFFGIQNLDLEKAKRGEAHFVQSCQRCHGIYEKAWSSPNAKTLSKNELLKTMKVTYFKKTPVRDVGTDPGRYQGMKEFSDDLNRLAISKSIGTVVEPQKGYVPPPLEGIWARWPYMHNNAIPSLCALLTKSQARPSSYYSGHAKNKDTDFDKECVGYPLGDKTPASWKTNKDFLYDTKKEGLSKNGHDEGIFLKDGQELYSKTQKLELIEYLKTL